MLKGGIIVVSTTIYGVIALSGCLVLKFYFPLSVICLLSQFNTLETKNVTLIAERSFLLDESGVFWFDDLIVGWFDGSFLRLL